MKTIENSFKNVHGTGWVRRGVCVGVYALLVSCSGAGPGVPDSVPKTTETGDAFEGLKCSSVRPPTEPDLMGWDAGSRAQLSTLRRQGVVAVRYKAQGCNVELEVLPNCIGKGTYQYAPYAATDTKVAHNKQELYAELPIGAARLGGKLRGGRALRTDYMLVGMHTLPADTDYMPESLKGVDCERATHVVSRVYLGGFAMAAGERSELDAHASVFLVKAGAARDASAEHIAREGIAEACEKAQADGSETPQCAVPLRVGLLAITGRADGGCPAGSTFDGKQCVQRKVVTQIDCPAGTSLKGTTCVGNVQTTCPAGLHFENGRGCIPSVTPHASVSPSATSSTPPAPVPGSRQGMVRIPAGTFWMGSNDDVRERPVHQVKMAAFWLDATEVTVAAYAACVRANDCPPVPTTEQWEGIYDRVVQTMSPFCNGNRGDRQNHPVNCVDWNDAIRYCRWAGKRLPSEEEWEYAARGTDGRKYPWGDAAPSARLLNACDSSCEAAGKALEGNWSHAFVKMFPQNDGWGGTAPVSFYPDGKSPFGAFDMAGNVAEWTSNSKKSNSKKKSLRGGGWREDDPKVVRATVNVESEPSYRSIDVGFRCARSD